jgi:RND superfamily putative drug exporter
MGQHGIAALALAASAGRPRAGAGIFLVLAVVVGGGAYTVTRYRRRRNGRDSGEPAPDGQQARPPAPAATGWIATAARAVVRYRVLVVAGWLVVIAVSSATLPSMSSEVNNDNSQFLSASAPSGQASALAEPLLGNQNTSSSITLVASRAGGPLTAADQAAIARELQQVNGVPNVISARESSVSHDGQAAQITIQARVNAQDVRSQETLVTALEATFPAARPATGLAFHLAGNIPTRVANQQSSTNSAGGIEKLSILLIIVLLIIVFRSPVAAVVTLLPAVAALLVTLRFVGGLGDHGLQISNVTQVLMIVLVLGAGTDYGLFLIFRVREGLRSGLDLQEAVIAALVQVGESITASAGTVILSLLTLLLAGFGIYHDLGIPLAIGIAVMLLAGLTLLPALLALLGGAVFWPSKVAAGQRTDGVWGRFAGRVIARPAITLAAGITIFLALAAGALSYHASGFGGAMAAPAGSDAAAGNAALAAHFPRTSANPANLVFRYAEPVWNDPQAVTTAESALRGSGQFATLSGPLSADGSTLTAAQYTSLHAQLGDPGALPVTKPADVHVPAAQYNAYRASGTYVSQDGRTIQFLASLSAGGQPSTAAMNATPAVRAVVATAQHRSGATASGLAGQAAALYDVNSAANGDLALIIPIAAVAIAILLGLVLRSLIAPLYLIVSVVLSYLAALGLSTVVSIDLAGQDGVTFLLPFLLFVFLLALGEDYNILVMTRIREEARTLPLREAVVKAIGATGTTVSSAGLILAGTFGVFAVVGGGGATGGQLRVIGLGLGVGILLDTFVVRTLLVPAAVVLIGRWNWWPSTLSRAGSGDHSQSAPRDTRVR